MHHAPASESESAPRLPNMTGRTNRQSPSPCRWILGVALPGVLLLASTARAQTTNAGAPPAADAAPPAAPAAPPAVVQVPPPVVPSPPTSTGVTATLYGFVELDMIHDSTQSFNEAITNNTMARPGTIAGDNPRTQFSARDSRVGLRLAAPTYGAVRTSAAIEVDFMGNQAPTANEDAVFSAAAVRLRHAWVKFETPVLDVLAGLANDPFAWGGNGFYPNTVAFLGVPGEIYHRDPQLRLSKILSSPAVTFEIAAAAVRPAQRDGEIPDGQGGLRVAFEHWRGSGAQGAGLPKSTPASLGVSGVYRHFSVPAFTASAENPHKANGWGAAVNLFLPLVPARGADLGNSLSATAEATIGTGISNLYTGLTGGVAFPVLPNPTLMLPAPVYNPDIDEGIVTYDPNGNLKTVNWRALVVGLQYRFPFGMGRKLGLSTVASQLESNNVHDVTPMQGQFFVFKKAQYVDGNLFFSPTPESQVGASVQIERQTFGDGVYGTNVRGQLAVYYFF
jgi:hypothetical protein